MRQVYLSSQGVVLWVGGEGGSPIAISFLRGMPLQENGNVAYEFHHDDIPKCVACDELFLKRPYWGRSWILQEVLHNRPVTVHIGEQAIDIDELFALFKKYFSIRKVLSTISQSGLTKDEQESLSKDPEKLQMALATDRWFRAAGAAELMPDSLLEMRLLFKDPHFQPRLGFLLYKFRDQGATVPKDKIYSLQGMAK